MLYCFRSGKSSEESTAGKTPIHPHHPTASIPSAGEPAAGASSFFQSTLGPQQLSNGDENSWETPPSSPILKNDLSFPIVNQDLTDTSFSTTDLDSSGSEHRTSFQNQQQKGDLTTERLESRDHEDQHFHRDYSDPWILKTQSEQTPTKQQIENRTSKEAKGIIDDTSYSVEWRDIEDKKSLAQTGTKSTTKSEGEFNDLN